MNISEAAAEAGLTAKAVRYYERVGLLNAPRSGNGYRVYGEREVHKLRFIARSRGLGFSVEDCKALLNLYEDQGRASADVKAIAKERLVDIDQKIEELKGLRDTLSHLVSSCAGDDRPDCPILKDLAK